MADDEIHDDPAVEQGVMPEPEPQEETTSEEERVEAAAAVVEAENEEAPTVEAVLEINGYGPDGEPLERESGFEDEPVGLSPDGEGDPETPEH